MQHKQLKAEQAWKRLQLDQSRDKPIAGPSRRSSRAHSE